MRCTRPLMLWFKEPRPRIAIDRAAQPPPGLDLRRLSDWLPAAVPGPAAASRGCGRAARRRQSNLTAQVTDADTERASGAAPPAARARAGHRARHGPRIPGDESALADRRAGPGDL